MKALRELRRKDEHQDPNDDSIHGEGCEAAFADVGHEPCDRRVRDDEGNYEADREHNPAVGIDLGDANGVLAFSAERFIESIESGCSHGWHR